MTMLMDPEGTETSALFDFSGGFTGQRVLEIGCGDGRLTWQYAPQAARIVAIDPDSEKIARARRNRPPELLRRATFHASGLESFAAGWFSSNSSPFDCILLAWSL